MIDNKIKGKSFSGCVKYVMNQKGAEMLDTNMSGRNPREIVAEFQFGRLLNSNVKSIVFHASMSAAPGEELSNDTWKDFARDYLKGMGFDDNQYIVVRHHEPEDEGKHDHAHVHIVASRVKLTGECVSASWDYIRSNNLMKELEQKYDLVPTPHHLSNQKEQHNPTKGEMRLLYQQQQEFDEGKRSEPPQPSARMKLQALIDELTQQPTTMTDLIDKLQSTGVEVRIKQTRNNVIQGISFAHPDWEHGFKGSDLGKNYTWKGLQTHKSVSFDPVRDAEAIANSATNSRTSTKEKIAAKQLQSEVADGIAGTVTAESQTASSRISDTSATARSSKDNARGDRTVEPAVNQPAAADHQFDPGKQLVETAVSSIARNFGERISRKFTEQSAAPSGTRAENTAAREKPAHQIDITTQLHELGSTVEQVNAELELQIGRNRSAGSDSRTASSIARNSQSTASPTIGIGAADLQKQFEEINRIHDGIRRKRKAELEQFNAELTSRTIAQGAETESLPEEITLLKVEESKTAQNSYDKSGSRIKNKLIDSESNDDNKLQQQQQPQRQRQVKNPSQQSPGTRPSTQPVNPTRSRTIASLISRVGTPESNGGKAEATQPNSTRSDISSSDSRDKSRAVEYDHNPELEKLRAIQAATARKIRELAAESKRLEAERDHPPETEPQQPSSRNQQPTNKNQQQYTPSYKSPEPDLEL